MARIRAMSAVVFCLALGASGLAGAQGKHGDKPEKAPHDEKAGPPPRAERPAQVPRQEKATRTEKPARVEHVRAAPAQRAVRPEPQVRSQRSVPTARAQRANPGVGPQRRALVVEQAEQQKRLRQQQQQALQYRRFLDRQARLAQLHEAQLLKQNRKAQYRFQQQYYARLAQQQRQLLTMRNYSRDPYISSPYVYQYVMSGTPRYTNQYGADVLKRAVDYGYQQGYQAGQADRQDGWAANYRNSYAYTDANYGYTGNYVSQSDYNYYFRQGFQRGYDDGYYSRSQYGNSLNGSQSILATVLSAILGLTSLR